MTLFPLNPNLFYFAVFQKTELETEFLSPSHVRIPFKMRLTSFFTSQLFSGALFREFICLPLTPEMFLILCVQKMT